jgi:hypothetical protein
MAERDAVLDRVAELAHAAGLDTEIALVELVRDLLHLGGVGVVVEAQAGPLERAAHRIEVGDDDARPVLAIERPQREAEAGVAAGPLVQPVGAGEDPVEPGEQLEPGAGDVLVDVLWPDVEGAQVHVEDDRHLLAVAEQVVLRDRHAELGQHALLDLVARVHAERPDVARHHQEVDLARAAALRRDRRDDHEGGEEWIPQAAPGLVHHLVVPGLPGAEQHLAFHHVLVAGPMKDVEPGEEALLLAEDVLVDHVDVAEHLAIRVRVEAKPAGVERALQGGPLVGPER